MTAENAEHFGTLPTGEKVRSVVISKAGARAKIMSYGASLIEFHIDPVPHSLVLGSKQFKSYVQDMRFFGATVGRVANRIKDGVLNLNGKSYALSRNEKDRQTLHGGIGGTGARNWVFDMVAADRCSLSCHLPDGEDGFPGAIDIFAEYRIDEKGALNVDLSAKAEATTVCNLAHHSYWNLSGAPHILDHHLRIDADYYLPVDEHKIPTGEQASVEGGAFDFRTPRPFIKGQHIDHNFCLNAAQGKVRKICQLLTQSMVLDVFSDQPGLQVYDAYAMDTAPALGHSGQAYQAHAGLALEPQKWPDALRHSSFPSIVLEKGESYQQHSIFHAYAKP